MRSGSGKDRGKHDGGRDASGAHSSGHGFGAEGPPPWYQPESGQPGVAGDEDQAGFDSGGGRHGSGRDSDGASPMGGTPGRSGKGSG